MGTYAYSGQVCISIQRIYLHHSIYDKFLSDFVDAVNRLKIGDPMDESTDVGPMINEDAAKQTEEWVDEAVRGGAHVLTGGNRKGTMYEPTVLVDVKPDMRVSWLEAFAPIAVFYRYHDYEDALKEVNNSMYGLQAGVFTNDLKKAFRAQEVLDVGGVIINDIPTFRIDHMPYGGIKESGFGREGLKYAMEEMTEMKLMAVNLKI
jgi:glyceraldehyde-3-phosphate dehydrogenase (NADP+)